MGAYSRLVPDHDIAALYLRLHSAARSDPDKCICSAAVQFFHCDRSRRTANPRGCHTDLFSIHSSGICNEFPIISDQDRIIKIFCDLCTPLGVSRHDHVSPHFSFCHLYMVLPAGIFRIILHPVSSSPFQVIYRSALFLCASLHTLAIPVWYHIPV